jgi:nucleotide-binding universal stress UspA family protein
MRHVSRILLPIEPQTCPAEAFSLVNGMANRSPLAVILLQTVKLNVLLPERRVYDELALETHDSLHGLAHRYLPADVPVQTRVRFGEPAQEILSEAKAENVDVIVLPNHGPSFWQRLRFVWKSTSNPLFSALVEQVTRGAQCDVWITGTRDCFDRGDVRARPGFGDTVAAAFCRSSHPAQLASPRPFAVIDATASGSTNSWGAQACNGYLYIFNIFLIFLTAF